MNKLPSMSTRDVLTTLQKAGFVVKRQRDHIRLQNGTCSVSVPHFKHEIRYRTLRLILKQSGLTVEEFERLRGE